MPRPPQQPALCLCLQLRNALAEPGGEVPGFMLVADCLVRGGKDGGEGGFAGMIMGELHGEGAGASVPLAVRGARAEVRRCAMRPGQSASEPSARLASAEARRVSALSLSACLCGLASAC